MSEVERRQDRAPVPTDWTYAPAPEARDIVAIEERYGHYVAGEWLEPTETYTTLSPATEEPLAEVGQATPAEVGAAVSEVEIDGFPGTKFSGVVDSISAGTGSRFSLLPPENATGNWVKVVQRVPVKIVLDAREVGNPQPLRAGMSAVVTIKVH